MAAPIRFRAWQKEALAKLESHTSTQLQAAEAALQRAQGRERSLAAQLQQQRAPDSGREFL